MTSIAPYHLIPPPSQVEFRISLEFEFRVIFFENNNHVKICLNI